VNTQDWVFLKKRILFLTVLEAGKFQIKAAAGSMVRASLCF
jgi:hypothetical protein